MRLWLRLAAIVCVVTLGPVLTVRSAHAVPSRAAFPAAMEQYFAKTARLSDTERADLAAGKPIAKLLDADPNKEIAVFGAVWIAGAAREEYVRRLSDIESFERGGPFLVTKKLSDPPVASDFSSLVLPDDDLKDLRSCKTGDCELKLGEKGIETIRKGVDWKTPTAPADANALIRRLALELVTAYREGGNEQLAVYRDKDRPTFVAREFRSMVDGVPSFGETLPELKQYLVEYPRATLADGRDLFYWQEVKFGVKPTIRITHLVIEQRPDRTVVASKLLYASHYFWTALGLRVLLPDPARGAGFWFITVNRSRSDGLSGFTGTFVRGRARGDAQKGALLNLNKTKAALEKS
jgi:hypothetical protein